MKIGNMAYRIGEILDLFEQFEWMRRNGFDEVSFHSVPGSPPAFEGFSPFGASESAIERLRQAVSGFEDVDVHGPFASFDVFLASRNPRILEASLNEIGESMKLAGKIGAKTVTIHDNRSASIRRSKEEGNVIARKSLLRLGGCAEKVGVKLCVETNCDCELVRTLNRPNIGLTIDVGHLYAGKAYAPYGSVGGFIKEFGDLVFLVHVHDYDGTVDHLEIGSGMIDFHDIINALHGIGYRDSLCLELNPDRVPPEGILRSRDKLFNLIRETS